MLPMEQFDSPESVRAHFELLRGPGAPAGRFRGVPRHDIEIVDEMRGEWLRALLRVPTQAAFFSDHFPRRAVFPGTLLLDAQITLALEVAARSKHWPTGARLAASRVPDMKMRAFISPGTVVELRIDLEPPNSDGAAMAKTSARIDDKTVATGRLEIAARGMA
jgi:3-hydroxymyristoyl/3-hydroxydecanoyl-(acyl carrier protein) dehydratase